MDFSSFLGTMKYYVKRISTLAAVETEAYVQKFGDFDKFVSIMTWTNVKTFTSNVLCATLGKEDKKLPICLCFVV